MNSLKLQKIIINLIQWIKILNTEIHLETYKAGNNKIINPASVFFNFAHTKIWSRDRKYPFTTS